MTVDATTENPYVGPRPFLPHEYKRFFGRDWEAEELVALIIAHPAVLFYAQSGAGKSSLLNARIIFKLEVEEKCEVLPIARVRGDVPLDIEAGRIRNIYLFNTLLGWTDETDVKPVELLDLSLINFLRQLPRRSDGEGYPALRVIIFDQFEELFVFYPDRWPEREQFFNQINQTLMEDPFLRVLFVIREDYLAQLDPYVETLPERLRPRFRLERLQKEAALAAVEGPLAQTRRTFAPGVAAMLVDELLKIRVEDRRGEVIETQGEFVEPVQLQVVCQNLWQELPPDVTEITTEHLRAFGSVDQALIRFYERAIRTAAQQTGFWEWRLRLWFEREFVTPAGTRGLVYRGRKKTGGVPNKTVDVLEGQHLIRGERRAGSHWYELTHDRLIGPIQQSNHDWWFGFLRKWAPIAAGTVLLLVITLAVVTGLFAQIAVQTSEVVKEAIEVRATGAAAQAASTAVVEAVSAAAEITAEAARQVGATSTAVAKNVGQFVDVAQATAQAAEVKRATAQAVSQAPAGSNLLPTDVSTALAVTEEAARAAAATVAGLLPVDEGTPTPTDTATPTPIPTATPLFIATPTPTDTPATPPSPETPASDSTPLPTATSTPRPPISWPPPGQIIFTSARLSAADLYLMDADGSNVTRLTLNVAFDPSYAPDTDRVVFTSLLKDQASIYIMDLDGSSQTNAGETESDNWDPTFSPDGRRIAFVSSREGGEDIYSMAVDGSDIRRLTNHPAKDYAPAWSPNGSYIAFVSDRTGQADIWLMEADGSDQVRLTESQAQDVNPAWSPSGWQIVFASTRSGNADIYTMEITGRNQRNLTRSVFEENYPAWSYDGNWLAFSRFTTSNDIFVMTVGGACPRDLPQELIFETTRMGDCMVNLTNSSDPDWAPIWIPEARD